MKIRRKKASQTKVNKIFPDKERISDIKNKKLFNTSTAHDVIVLIG